MKGLLLKSFLPTLLWPFHNIHHDRLSRHQFSLLLCLHCWLKIACFVALCGWKRRKEANCCQHPASQVEDSTLETFHMPTRVRTKTFFCSFSGQTCDPAASRPTQTSLTSEQQLPVTRQSYTHGLFLHRGRQLVKNHTWNKWNEEENVSCTFTSTKKKLPLDLSLFITGKYNSFLSRCREPFLFLLSILLLQLVLCQFKQRKSGSWLSGKKSNKTIQTSPTTWQPHHRQADLWALHTASCVKKKKKAPSDSAYSWQMHKCGLNVSKDAT